ncbi:MAG TPA: polysaccharide deacetylase family protein [Streptosporangiaceae bacterium]|nr:polysaccharide deacetylase family protein [Streptosporangiaceae bacterium]
MSARRLRSLAAVMVAVGVTGVSTVMFPAAAAAPAAATAKPPPPGGEGPAGPPARMPDGRVARPPRGVSPQASTGCPAAPYGTNSYAPGTGKTVALTFDDGPGASTPGILSILARYGVTATFFNLGQNMAAQPALVRQEAGTGYMLGNHTWDHPDMAGLSTSAQAAEMDRTIAEQVSLVGSAPCAFRPPYGYPDYNSTTLSLAQQRRMKVWLWSVDTEDWMANGSSSSYWVHRIIALAEQEGGVLQHPVVLMHNAPAGDPATVLALPAIISYFRSRGYTFVNLAGGTGWSSRQTSPAAAQASGTVDVFWTSTDTTLGHHFYVPGGGWRGPQGIGGEPVAGEPSVTTSSPGTVDGFWEGADGHLWHQFHTSSSGWSRQQPMLAAGLTGGPPSAVGQADGGVDVFWRGTDNHLWHLTYRPGSGWSGLQHLGGDLASNPAPATSSPGTVDVLWQGADGHLWHAFSYRGGAWSAPVGIGTETVSGQPAATGQLSGTVDVFWKDTTGHLEHTFYIPGSGWWGPNDLGGSMATDPAPVASAPGTVDVFWRGTDGHLWHAFVTAGQPWSGASSLGMGTLGSRPWATAQPSGTIDVFWRGTDAQLWHAFYAPGHGWSGAGNLGGDLDPVS